MPQSLAGLVIPPLPRSVSAGKGAQRAGGTGGTEAVLSAEGPHHGGVSEDAAAVSGDPAAARADRDAPDARRSARADAATARPAPGGRTAVQGAGRPAGGRAVLHGQYRLTPPPAPRTARPGSTSRSVPTHPAPGPADCTAEQYFTVSTDSPRPRGLHGRAVLHGQYRLTPPPAPADCTAGQLPRKHLLHNYRVIFIDGDLM